MYFMQLRDALVQSTSRPRHGSDPDMFHLIQTADLALLPVDDRLRLIEEIWDSLDIVAEDLPLPEWHREEIDMRLDALDQGVSVGTPWDEVRRRITGKP